MKVLEDDEGAWVEIEHRVGFRVSRREAIMLVRALVRWNDTEEHRDDDRPGEVQ